jgi:hypothetical protein
MAFSDFKATTRYSLLLLCALFVLGSGGVIYTYTIGAWQKDAERVVHENTRSYVHGKQQELAKMYREYTSGDEATKAGIKAAIQASFAEFDESKIQSQQLKEWLVSQRGF